MRRKLLIGLCLAAVISLAAGDYLFNRSSGAQDATKKAEPDEKKGDLFDILKKTLEAKKEPQALPPLPLPPPALPMDIAPKAGEKAPLPPAAKDEKGSHDYEVPRTLFTGPLGTPPTLPTPSFQAPEPPIGDSKLLQTQAVGAPKPGVVAPPPVKVEEPKRTPQGPAIPAPSPLTSALKEEVKPALPIAPVTQAPPLDPKPSDTRPFAAVQPSVAPVMATPTVIKTKTSPWTLHVEVVDDVTIITASVNKKHEFKIVCQSLDLQTGKDTLKAIGKVIISGDALNGSCDRLAISLIEDRLVLEGNAEVQIQKTVTSVGSDSSAKPAAFELKGETLNLRISELQSGKYLQTSWSRGAADRNTDRPLAVRSMGDGKQWSAYGTLRRTQTANGSTWRLADGAGQTILNLVTPDGRSLEQYEGRTISVYGTALDKMTVRVSHIALP